ncbi:MFS transporter [Legionella nagasakiensis]|uniref:MFS transporter n=1 Tax=Legionella nagasakiensis TaxID=535290 RepID=UPI0010543F82|nr:MFS transporter [Legionella nagasakiensis]
MLLVIAETFAPLLSLFIFILGAGFFSTLLALVMTLNGASTITIGAMTGIFYAGVIFGSFRIERFITRVGHIRAYSVFSSTLAVVCLLHGVFYSIWLWLILRFIAGFVSAGLFVVIESWLLCKSTHNNRGQILALYMITFYGAQSLGQFILNLGDPQTMLLFAVASMTCSLSIIPLSMTYVQSPQYDEPSTLGLKKLLNQSASGLLGCFSSGLIMGGIYGLMPTFLSHLFHSRAEVAKYMFAIIVGGMMLQYPVGKLSDVFERRLMLIIISLATIFISLAVIFINPEITWLFFSLMALVGGLTFTLYPISITQACDALDTADIVAGTQSLLLAYSIGAMIGPFIAPVFMQFFGSYGLFIYFISICAFSIPLFIIRKAQKADIPQEEPFMSMPQTSPILLELDPRGDVNQS